MANVTRVHVELKDKFNGQWDNFQAMLREFRKRVTNAGVLHDLKRHEYFETRSQKQRRKLRESKLKHEMEVLEEKILLGERVDAPPGLIKRVMAKIQKKEKKRGSDVEE